ncbi:MAG TPA: PhoPQ-activated protein PqaA family protein [Gammaproteobacteria bacterium]
MNRNTAALALLGLLAGGVHAEPDSPPETALRDYVEAPDPTFSWHVQARYQAPGAEVVELRLHSQTWRDVLWKHQLYLIRPDDIDPGIRQGMLVIGGGRWRESYDTNTAAELPEEAPLFIGIAQELGTVVAVLAQVPFQPMFGLREDDLIAHTFQEFLETGDAEWPLLLPMVKSAVRAMDAVQAFTSTEWNLGIERFTVLGGSKRGWTTWLTGAVEPRAATLVPIVIDVLNFEAHLPHQEAIWGALSQEIAPYTSRGLDDVLGTDQGGALRRIVDPYSYRRQLTQPKLVVIATNDAYFPIDSLNLYWNGLPEPKRVLYLPNDGHDIEDLARLIPALDAMHRNGEADEPLPRLEWEFENGSDGLRVCVTGDPVPAAVSVWTAASEDTDFREERFSSRPAEPAEDGVFVFEDAAPIGGYKAMFAEAAFGEGDARFTLSTSVSLTGPGGGAPFPETAAVGEEGICPEGS